MEHVFIQQMLLYTRDFSRAIDRGFTSTWSFIIIRINIKITKLVTAVYDQKQVIFNQKPINRLALLTGALCPHDRL